MSKFSIQQQRNNRNSGPMAISLFSVRWLIFGLMILGLITYVWQINNLATYGYRMRELEKQSSNLTQINKSLENKVANLKSIEFLKQKIDQLALTPVSQVEYLTPISSVIAQK